MTVLILDTRALEVMADPEADIGAARRMRDILTAAARMGIPVRVPTAVLAEAYRGIPADAALDRVLGRGIRPVTMGQAMARLAGGLRYRDRLNSCHTVDALGRSAVSCSPASQHQGAASFLTLAGRGSLTIDVGG